MTTEPRGAISVSRYGASIVLTLDVGLDSIVESMMLSRALREKLFIWDISLPLTRRYVYQIRRRARNG